MNYSDTCTKIREYFTDKPVTKVMVFGSYARHEGKEKSDIDLIIQPSRPVGLFVLGQYIADLEDILHRRVDLATENSITPEFLKLIQNDLQVVYAA